MRTKKGWWLVFAVVALVGWTVIAQQFPVKVVNDQGVTITITSRPERIVVAGIPLYTQILVDIGALDRIVGVASSPDNPPEVKSLPQVGPSFSPSVEEILALKPDLVLGAYGGVRNKLKEMGTIALTTGMITSVPDIFATIRTVGTAVGNLKQANALIGKIAEQIIKVESKVLGRDSVRAAFLYMNTPDTPPYAAGSGAIENDLIFRAGGKNVFADVSGFPRVSLEEVIARDPQVIFTDPSQVKNIIGSKLLQGVAAVKDGRVYGIKASATTSTRVAETLQKMAQILHPAAFSK